MESREEASRQPDSQPQRLAEEVGRKAAHLWRSAGPRLSHLVNQTRPKVEKAVGQARPKVEKAGREAIEYAKAHEDELKAGALRIARMRLTGPLGLVVDGIARQAGQAERPQAEASCAECGTVNPTRARFCSNCGAALAPAP